MYDGVIVGKQNNIEEAMRTYMWKALTASIKMILAWIISPTTAVLQKCFVIIIFPPVSVWITYPHLLSTVLTKRDTEQVQSENF